MLEKIKYAGYVVFTYLSIDQEAFFILMGLLCIDSFVGAIKEIRLGSEFSFKVMLCGISMKLLFLIVPVTLALMGKALGYDWTIVIKIVMGILTVSEGYSIVSNVYMAKAKKRVKKVDVISLMLVNTRGLLKNQINSLIGQISAPSVEEIDVDYY